MMSLTNEFLESHPSQENCHICKKKMKTKTLIIKIIVKLEIIVIILVNTDAAHGICNLKYSITKEVSLIVHSGPKYDYHFIIKELTKEFKGQFSCLGKDTKNI